MTPPAAFDGAEFRRIADAPPIPRYTKNAFGWWLHDFFVHPVVGTIGLFGRLCGSLRIITVSHHIHNSTAPSNDSVADYIESMTRACHNETIGSNGSVKQESPMEAHLRRVEYSNGLHSPETEMKYFTAGEELRLTQRAAAKLALEIFEHKSAAEHFETNEHAARHIAQNADHPKMVELRKQHQRLLDAVAASAGVGHLLLSDILEHKK